MPMAMSVSPISMLALLLFGFTGQFVAAQPSPLPARAELAADLDAVPRDAAAFVHIRARDLWQTDALKEARHLLDRAGPEAWKEFARKSPINPSTIDRITLVMLTSKTLAEPFPS